RDLLGRLAHLALLALPLRAGQPVDLRLLAFHADVALDEVDLVGRHVQAVALRVLQVQVVALGAVQQQARHAPVDADAVVDVDDEIPGVEIRPRVQAYSLAEAESSPSPPPAHPLAVRGHDPA